MDLVQVIGEKGQHVEGAVSCWRSVFVANEFCELGSIRRTQPALSFIILVRACHLPA
jgi:Meckelin (Transmembrane protein 67)